MIRKFSLTLKKQVGQLLHSMAEKLESESQETGETPPPSQLPLSERSQFSLPSFFNLPRQGKTPWEKVSSPLSPVIRKAQAFRRHPKFWLILGIGAGVSSSAIALSWGWHQLESTVKESVEEILTYTPEGTLTIKAADGVVLQEVGPVTHEKLKIWQFPARVLEAFIASEDSRFEQHGGVDPQGILRAAFSNLQAGEVVEGASTITQQLARIVFLTQERSFGRKFKEMRLAQKIEQKFPKQQILERYLNLVYLGSGAYGVGDAAWVYFSKPVDKLTLSEAATLAGIIPAPSVYSPLENEKVATERRNIVLKRMEEEGFITPEQASSAIASPLVVKPSLPKRLERKAPYFTDYIQKQLPQYIPAKVLKAGGITVETTLNSKWQEKAESVIEKAVNRYGRWQGFKQAALVSIDPRTGQIKAMVGGNDFDKNQYNRVTQAKRQPGSTFKTFVYATAIATGMSPHQSFLNSEYVVDGYKPENYGDKYSGAAVSLPQALASSINVVAVQVLVKVGWNPVIKLAHSMGIESNLQRTYSLALGASEVTPLELTSAYGTLANGGVHEPVYGISRILDRHGKVLYQAKFVPKTALDPETTAIMTWMLQGVVTSGTGAAAQIGRPVAGKTGTSDKARDLWFVGYIPQLVTGVWLGNDNNYPTGGASSTAAAIWRQFMLTAKEKMPIESFPPLPRLAGRKATIKAEPIRPRSSSFLTPTPSENDQKQQVIQGQEEQPKRRRRRRNKHQEEVQRDKAVTAIPSETPSERRRRPSRNVGQPSQAISVPEPQGAAAPASTTEGAPLAPPAERKQE